MMIKRISKARNIKEKLRKEGKSSFLERPEHLAAIVAMNEQLEIAKREYQIKDRNSQITAANVILNS